MWNNDKILKCAASAFLLLGSSPLLSAQDNAVPSVVEVQALFEYPMAPEELESINDRSTWVVEHFWDKMDFNRLSVDQAALNHAFRVYAVAMQWADKDAVLKSVDDLNAKLQGNPGLQYQFVRAAETNLYGPQAEMWVDEIYLKFLKGAAKNKKLGKQRLAKLQNRIKILENNQEGKSVYPFKYTLLNGKKGKFAAPAGKQAMVVFAKDGDVNARMMKVQLSSNPEISKRLAEGALALYFITDGEPSESWKNDAADYPEGWIAGIAPGLDQVCDIRFSPSIYLIGADGLLLHKNLSLEMAVDLLKNGNDNNSDE